MRVCKLCNATTKLCESHIIPKFVSNWLKESSATGYMRHARNPNLRQQDGFKAKWLCAQCEKRFNEWETEFAKKIFYPLHNDNQADGPYGPWLMKFAVSVSWRSLQYLIDDAPGLDHFPIHLREKALDTLSRWNNFLLERVSDPAGHEQHMLLLGSVGRDVSANMPANINRYILRSYGLDGVCNQREAIVFTKMCRVFLIGFIEMPNPQSWKGTKIHLRKGTIPRNRHYKIPGTFGNYLLDQSKKVAGIHGRISEEQTKKIWDTFSQNIDRAVSSETFKAMHQDVVLFGDDAFKK